MMGLRIISFDVDGTLVDPDYNDLIWLQVLPEMVAEKENIDFDTALKRVQHEYDRLGEKDFRWYNLNYWLNYFQIDVDYQKLLEQYEHKIKIFSEVPDVLEQLSSNYQLICTSTMPREFMEIKIKKIKKYFQSTFSTLTDYKQLKGKKVYDKISQRLEVIPQMILHIGDHEKLDYFAAREAGWNAILIDRYHSGFQNKYPDSVIHNLSDIFDKIKLFS